MRASTSGRSSVWRERVWLGDQGVVAFVIDSWVDKPTDHAPCAVTYQTHKKNQVHFNTAAGLNVSNLLYTCYKHYIFLENFM